ncbi:hypothetical protein M514_07753 [Trichuris suis]|uniref:RNA-directed DNA polymerase n=1 Tax=Trichuris suis TaxID=68888 RepID=A0A085MS25_9BILA|nr:hypothetical protein M514_07753 [Trichuris suis]
MAKLGPIEEFDVSNPAGWLEYSERLQFHFEANGTSGTSKRLAVLCSVCGPKTYSIIRSLTFPDSPASKSFEQVLKLLNDHFLPKSSEIYHRFVYQRRLQRPDETVSSYVAELRRLAQYCNFGDILDSTLRDQLVCGLRDQKLQRQLLCVSELTFSSALSLALTAEAYNSEVAKMHSPHRGESQDVQLIRRDNHPQERVQRTVREQAIPAGPRKTSCYRCGEQHSPASCRFKSATCNFCKRVGHIERVCRSKVNSSTAKQKQAAKRPTSANLVGQSSGMPFVNATHCQTDSLNFAPFATTVHLNGMAVKMEAGIRLKRAKCVFGLQSINFLGYRIDSNGIHPAEEKVAAIHKFPPPKNKQQLQAFLGLLNFYHNFLPNKAEIAEPAFNKLKRLVLSSLVLAQYDDSLPLTLTCDASPYGVGCFGSYHARRKYAQIDREALAIVVGIKKFHQYIFGRHVQIQTDHKPLLGMLARAIQTPVSMSPRMMRWSILLSAYDYDLLYRPGKQISNADALSRLPLSAKIFEDVEPLEALMLESPQSPQISAQVIARETSRDPVLERVRDWTRHGWPRNPVSEAFKPFVAHQNELSVHKDCVIRGCRVVVPQSLRTTVLQLLHAGHPGIVRMKSLARSYVWWPRVDKDIERAVQTCSSCQQNRHDPPRENLNRWPEAEAPWSRIHVDFFGPFQGKMFFIVVDAFSKWVEVNIVPIVSSKAAISSLRNLFATHGLPDCVVSDNGTAFTSVEFAEFMKSNCIRHLTAAPFHPASNGQAERLVQSTKEALRKEHSGDWNVRLARLLLAQHTTPCTATGKSPAEFLCNRRLSTLLDKLCLKSRHHDDATSEHKKGRTFQQNRHDPPRENLNRWPEAEAPWSRIHVDFFGPFQGKMFFIVVDAFSKWVEVNIVPTVSSKAAISSLRNLFATHGLPDCVLLLSRPEMSVIISNRKLRDNCSVRWAVSMHNTEFFPDLIKDDTLAKQETIEDGSFHLDGTDDEIGTIEPELKVYHRCNSKHVCKRRWIIKIPDRYKYSPSANERVFVVGTVNLEIHLKEDKKCLPV